MSKEKLAKKLMLEVSLMELERERINGFLSEEEIKSLENEQDKLPEIMELIFDQFKKMKSFTDDQAIVYFENLKSVYEKVKEKEETFTSYVLLKSGMKI